MSSDSTDVSIFHACVPSRALQSFFLFLRLSRIGLDVLYTDTGAGESAPDVAVVGYGAGLSLWLLLRSRRGDWSKPFIDSRMRETRYELIQSLLGQDSSNKLFRDHHARNPQAKRHARVPKAMREIVTKNFKLPTPPVLFPSFLRPSFNLRYFVAY